VKFDWLLEFYNCYHVNDNITAYQQFFGCKLQVAGYMVQLVI